jgi:hypothetical protein
MTNDKSVECGGVEWSAQEWSGVRCGAVECGGVGCAAYTRLHLGRTIPYKAEIMTNAVRRRTHGTPVLTPLEK